MTNNLKKLVEALSKKLKAKNLKVATAESCTGGGLSYWLTSLPGSSNWFDGGIVSYSDEAKIALLDVKPHTLVVVGAVSEQAAREMAEGILKKSNADISIAVTGIAGPSGGTIDKPVGTVWIAFAGKSFATTAKVDIFPGDRDEIRLHAIEAALVGLHQLI